MQQTHRHRGFSLTEVLMAIATLAVGMLFIGGTLAVAVHLSFMSNDQTLGSLVIEDALAKIRLYGMEPNESSERRMSEYKKDELPGHWTELQREVMLQDCNTYEVTGNINKTYYTRILYEARFDFNQRDVIDVAVFVLRDNKSTLRTVEVTAQQGSNQIALSSDASRLLVHGTQIVDDASGQVYRVFQLDMNNVMRLDRPWTGPTGNVWIWTVENQGTGPNPLITVINDYIPKSQLRSGP